MSGWLARQPPRLQGAIACAVGVGVALTGVWVGRMLQDQYYPIVIPGGGLAFGFGLFQIVTGYGRTDIRDRKIPAAWAGVLLALMIAGIAAGLELNHMLYGARW